MKMAHFLQVDEATGRICAEWQGDLDKVTPPVMPAGVIAVDVTELARQPGHLSKTHEIDMREPDPVQRLKPKAAEKP